MKRLTSKRCNGIKSGYWSSAKKDELVQRLGRYEDTGVPPENFPRWISTADRLPADGETVLMTVSGQVQNVTRIDAVELGYHDSQDGWIVEYLPEWTDAKISRWMPIPPTWPLPKMEPQTSGWVRTEDRLPEAEYEAYREKYKSTDPMELIVMISGGLAPTMLLWSPEEGFMDELGASYKVTHWMEMPQAPGEET